VTPPDHANELGELFRKLGYRWCVRAWDLNLIGLRGLSTQADAYDDAIGCVYHDGTTWRSTWHRASTDPGAPILAAPVRAAGAATLAAGQHRGSHRVGVHHGATARPALVATGSLPVWRDANRDQTLDAVIAYRQGRPWPTSAGLGINIHSGGGSRVGKWSEGCQVTAAGQAPIDGLIGLVNEQARRGLGSTVSYTLIDRSQAPTLVDAILGEAT